MAGIWIAPIWSFRRRPFIEESVGAEVQSIVIVADATALLEKPVATAIALTVVFLVTAKPLVYLLDAAVGVEPLMV